MNSTITLDEVIASSEKNDGHVLSWHPKDFRDLKKINKKAKFDVTWVTLKFVTVSGKKVPCRVKLSNQIIASGAKAPQAKDDDDNDISTFTIQFKSLERSDIEGGDYVPRTMDSDEKQEAENKRIKDNIDEYAANNEKLIQVLDILNKSFRKVANEIIEAEKNKELEFTVQKDRKKKDAPIIHLIKQTTRFDEDKKEDIALPSPIFRIKLPVYKKDGRIGTWNTFKDCFRPIVFDARKMTKKNGFKPVPAYVRSGKKKVELNSKNVTGFITYKSLISGSINFESITLSKAGISLGNKFHEMYIIRHKSASAPEVISQSETINMRSGMGSDDEGSDVEIDDVKINEKSSKSQKKGRGSGNDATDDEDDQHAPKGNDTSDGDDISDGADDPPSGDEKTVDPPKVEPPKSATSNKAEPSPDEPGQAEEGKKGKKGAPKKKKGN